MEQLRDDFGTREDLAVYRLQTSKSNLKSARILLDAEEIRHAREMGRKISEAEEIRHASDYDDFYVASRDETERQIAAADEFIQLVEKYCMTQLKEAGKI